MSPLVVLLFLAPAQVPAGDQCTMPDDNGVWRPCEEVFRERAEREAKERAPADEEKVGPRKGGRVEPDMSGFSRHTTPEPGRRGGYKWQIVTDPTIDLLPLVQMRKGVEKMKQQVVEVEPTRAAQQALPAQQRLLEIEIAALEYVEVLGLREVRECVAIKYPERLNDYAPPAAVRMTAGGPVPTSPDEQAVGTPPDPLGCERIHLIKQETIDKARRLKTIERLLDDDDFGWNGRDEKERLQEEREVLLEELVDPFRIPKLKATKRYQVKKPTKMVPINRRR